MGIVSIDFIQLHYKHAFTYMSHIKELNELIKSKGGHPHGWYLTIAGGADEIVVFTHWESMAARNAAHDSIAQEQIALHHKLAKCIQHHHNVIAMPNPKVHKEGSHDETKLIRIGAYKANGNPMAAGTHYADLVNQWKAKSGSDSKLRGVLHPIAFTGPYNLISVFEEGPSGMDDNIKKMMTTAADPANAEMMTKTFSEFTALSARICKPLTDEYLAKLPKHD
mgnify:CR=1 FL=1